ncbi:MAG: ATP-binding cassette domain-containing protein, partial [Candidatus Omnitrophica bacterium]|nr:ATP-binding cassette domain-containing protein [Candidatus Omnitrophota bacterium]
MAEVRLKNVKKSFVPGTYVVNDVTFRAHDKEFIVLVGPSGCGKSTTLRLVAGLETATAGEIYIGERRVNNIPPKDRDIAMVFQNYALYLHMTVYEN